MSRPLRIQYPDAWYHVMNRGRRGEKIFETKEEYWLPGDLLEDLDEVFNSMVVQADSYALELVRYIHANPLEAGPVDNLQKYQWSTHKIYLSKSKKWK